MKNNLVKVIILVSLIFAGGVWIYSQNKKEATPVSAVKDIYYCPMHPQVKSDKPGICPICSMKLVKKENNAGSTSTIATSPTNISEKKILYWTDPMIPGYKAKDPGKSPMGMDLVPVYEESQKNESVPGYAMVSIDTQKQQLMGMTTAPVMKKTLTKTIHAYGYVAHDLELYDAQIEYIEAWQQFYSFLTRRPIKDEFRVDWREYYTKAPSQNRWRSDEKVKAQQRLVKAEVELIHMGLTETELQQLRKIKYGQPWVQPELLFFEKNYSVFVYAEISENDLGFIAPTQKVIVTIPVYQEATEGVIKSIAPVVDPMTRTSRVRIEIPQYKSELSVNMYVNIDIPVELDEAPVVPRQAIMDTGLSKIVFVQIKEGVFEPRQIQTGFEGDGMVAVESGLKEGDVIVTSGNFLLDSESRLQGSLAGGQ